MSTPRKLAIGLLVLTALLGGGLVLCMRDASLPGAVRFGLGALLVGGAVLAGWCVLRLTGRLRTRGRHRLWGVAVSYYAAALALVAGSGAVDGLLGVLGGVGLVALGVAGWGLAAELKRTQEVGLFMRPVAGGRREQEVTVH